MDITVTGLDMKVFESKAMIWSVILLAIGGTGWYIIVPSLSPSSPSHSSPRLTQIHTKNKSGKAYNTPKTKKRESIGAELPPHPNQPSSAAVSTISSNAHMASSEKQMERNAVLEKHREMREARRRYIKARHQWRKELNQAWQQAKKDGDYTLYNVLKEQEPNKAYFLK